MTQKVIPGQPNSTYEAETHYVENICVASTGCYVFRIYDAYGDGIAGYNSPAGTFTIRYNGSIKGICPSDGNFGKEFDVYGIGGGCAENDMILTSIDMVKYIKSGEQEVKGTIFNFGTEPLTSFEVTYTIGDYTSPVYVVDGINIKTGETYSFTHDVAYNFNKLGEVNVELTVGKPNGVEDNSPANNTLTTTLTVLDYAPSRRVVGEEGTGTWCGWCVRGHVFMDYMDEKYPDTWIGIAVHNGDPMVVDDYDTGMGN